MGKLQDKMGKITEIVNGFSGDVSFFVKDVKSGDEIHHRENEIFPTASTIKIFIMGKVLEEVDKGKINLDDLTEMLPKQHVRGSGILKEFTLNTKYKIRDIIMVMIVLSDNTATNMCIDLAGGINAVNDHIRKVGLEKTTLNNYVNFDIIGDDTTRLGVATTKEVVDYLNKMEYGAFISEEMKKVYFHILSKQQYVDQFLRYTPYNPYAGDIGIEQKLRIGTKTGFMTGVRYDAGYIFLDDKELQFAIASKNCKDTAFSAENEGSVMAGKIGEIVYDTVFKS